MGLFMAKDLRERLIDHICASFDKEFFLSLEEAIYAAYLRADKVARENLKHITTVEVRASNRRYFIDDALIDACESSGLEISWRDTTPKGGHFVVLNERNITLSHIETHQKSRIKKAKHRDMLARKNTILEPVQVDLYDGAPPRLDTQLHVAVVTSHPPTAAQEQTMPEAVDVTIPFSDWSDFQGYGDMKVAPI